MISEMVERGGPSADAWITIRTLERDDGAEFYRVYCGACRRWVHKWPGVRQQDLARADARQHLALLHAERS